eukprot:503367-Pyramimonas_sp.AAC.1
MPHGIFEKLVIGISVRHSKERIRPRVEVLNEAPVMLHARAHAQLQGEVLYLDGSLPVAVEMPQQR